MKAILRLISTVAVLLTLSGCGVGVSDNDAYSAQNRKDARALEDRLGSARGIYDGTFTLADARYPQQQARLTLNVVNVREGTNPDGSVHVRPALYGRFRLENVVTPTDYVSLTGDIDALGGINLTSLTNSPTPGGGSGGSGDIIDTLSIHGDMSADGAVNLRLTNTSGYWGTFVGHRSTTEAPSPVDGDDSEARDRLLRIYNNVVGKYIASISDGTKMVKEQLIITVSYQQSSAGTSLPVLQAHWHRMDFPEGIGDRQLSVTLNSLSGHISMKTIAGGGTVAGSGQMSGDGTWLGGHLDIDLVDFRGIGGRFVADRIAMPRDLPTEPSDHDPAPSKPKSRHPR